MSTPKLPWKLVCEIIREEMELDDEQVYLYNNKFNIPPDEKVYIAVALGPSKPFSNIRREVSNDAGLAEEQTTNFQCTLIIDVMSKGPIARDRKEEVILALGSTLSQRTQEENGFYIAPISSSFVPLSSLEGAAIPYRFNISVAIQYKTSKSKQIAYYDTFTDTVITEE